MSPNAQPVRECRRAMLSAGLFYAVGILLLGAFALSTIHGQESSEPQERRAGNSSITGRVIDEDGGVRSGGVRMFNVTTRDGYPSIVFVCASQTDADGNYVCPDLWPGQYILSFQPSSAGKVDTRKHSTTHEQFSLMFYPGSTESDSSIPIRLDSGKSKIVDLIVRPVPTYSVEGVLPDQESQAVGSLVAVSSSGFRFETELQFQGKGTLTVRGVPNGTYLLRADWSSVGEATSPESRHHGSAFVTVAGGDVEGVPVKEEKVATVDGIVTSDYADHENFGTVTFLGEIPSENQFSAPLEQDGHFSVRDLPQGRYDIRVGETNQTFVKSLKVGDGLSANSTFETSPGESHYFVKLVASSNVATIKGAVRVAAPGSSECKVLAQSATSRQFYTADVDRQGNFFVTGLAPGSYYLYAWSTLEGVEYANPRFLQKYIQDRKEVIVGEGATVAGIELEVIDRVSQNSW